MKIRFLGTGTSQGVPLISCRCPVCMSTDPKDNRLRSSVLVETEQTTLVIDTGPDFRQQMLREQIDRLHAVVFTHSHKDHTAGFDDIRAFNYIQKKAMDVYADMHVEIALKRDFHYVFDEFKYPGVPDIVLHRIDKSPFEVNGLMVNPIEVLHYKMPVLGFRIGDFTYITDANAIDNKEKDKIRNSKILVLNALRKEKHISHFTLQEAIELSQELNAESTYLTHISHQLGLHSQISAELPSGVHLAYDGLCLEI